MVARVFGARLLDLAKQFHVWVIESPANRAFVDQAWKESQRQGGKAYTLASGITAFPAGEGETPESTCARIASTIDEHHGIVARSPPWCRIEVFGATLTPKLKQVFEGLGASSFTLTAEGFVCSRDV